MQSTELQLNKILVIQTAFIGDVILATALLEKVHHHFPKAQIDFLLRKGNESLFQNHPFINQLLIWDKTSSKYRNLYKLTAQIRRSHYDAVINLQRFFSSGLLIAASKAQYRIGYDKNPWAVMFTHRISHQIGDHTHEVTRILSLTTPIISDETPQRPKLYPNKSDYQKIESFQQSKYVCIAPTSVWYTKQHAAEKWVELINRLKGTTVYLLGAKGDHAACEFISKQSIHPSMTNLAGELSLLQSAALMEGAVMNYVNDSAPLHLASSLNAPVTAVFCSTIPAFGFTPLSDNSSVVETHKELACRPCGLHGKRSCKIGTFECSKSIDVNDLLNSINS